MFLRLGFLVGLCLVGLVQCEDDEVIKCPGGECVKLHLCPNGQLNTDGANIIDIRFNPDNECEDYLLKCCPFDEDEDDEEVIPPPASVTNPPTGSETKPPSTHDTDPIPGSVPSQPPPTPPTPPPPHGTGPTSTPGDGPGAGDHGSQTGGNGSGGGSGVGGGGGKPHGHGHHQGCSGYGGCQRPAPGKGEEHDEQAHLVEAEINPGSGKPAVAANQVKATDNVPKPHGSGPPVPSAGATDGPAKQQPASTGAPKPGGAIPPPAVGLNMIETSTTAKPGSVGAGKLPAGATVVTPKPVNQGPQSAGPGNAGVNSGPASTPKPGDQSGTAPGTGAGTAQGGPSGSGGAGSKSPSQQGSGGAGTKTPAQTDAGLGAGGSSPPSASGTGTGGTGKPSASGSAKPTGQQDSKSGTPVPSSPSVGGAKPGSSSVPGANVAGATTLKPTQAENGIKHTNVGGGGYGGTNKPGLPLTTDRPITVPQKCGVRNVDGVGFRITGDNDGESEYGEFPWMVAILKEEKALDQVINVYQCGGSLIHPAVVLTAAHCVQNRKAEEIKVRLGEWDTQTKNEIYDYQDRNVVEIVSHPEYYKGGLFNDVALLFLDKPAELMDTVNTICLPPADFNFDLSRCFASGWGKDVFGKQGTYQVILKKIELPIMPRDDCQKALRKTRLGHRFKLHSSFICAGGEKGRDTCKGDGGSPLVCPIPGTVNQYYQAGMVAWGIGCGEDGIPGVYVNVPMFRGWIEQHLTQRNVTHSYFIPT